MPRLYSPVVCLFFSSLDTNVFDASEMFERTPLNIVPSPKNGSETLKEALKLVADRVFALGRII